MSVKVIIMLAMSHFCFHCQVQGIRNELFSNEICSVVALEEIKGHFPAGTTFEDYWPAKGSIEALPNTRASAGAGNWTQKPAGQPNKMQVRQRWLDIVQYSRCRVVCLQVFKLERYIELSRGYTLIWGCV